MSARFVSELEEEKPANNNFNSFSRKSKKLSVKGAFLYLVPDAEEQSLHPANGWLICTGGLLVARTGYGVVEIRNSRDQNCQHGFRRFIFSMLSAAWNSLTLFFCFFAAKKHPTEDQLAMEPECSLRCISRINRFSFLASCTMRKHYLK